MSNAHSRIQHPSQGVALEGADRVPIDEDSIASVNQSETDRGWESHPIDIRISIPLIFGRWYFTLVGQKLWVCADIGIEERRESASEPKQTLEEPCDNVNQRHA